MIIIASISRWFEITKTLIFGLIIPNKKLSKIENEIKKEEAKELLISMAKIYLFFFSLAFFVYIIKPEITPLPELLFIMFVVATPYILYLDDL